MARFKYWIALVFACGLGRVSAQTTPIYSFAVSSDTGYYPTGNLKDYTDSVTGTWSIQYDSLNRMHTANASAGLYNGANLTWEYDSFGNRKDQSVSGNPSVPVGTYHATFNDGTNHITSNGSGIAPAYDGAGNLTFDGRYYFAYDAESRLCAVYDSVLTGNITQYLYDAEGHRIAKGHPAQPTVTPVCTSGGSDFIPAEKYIVGQNGEQITQLDGSDKWQHTNVYSGSQLIATYDQNGSEQLLHFNITDPLGTKRIQTTATGSRELTCSSLPFGDGPQCVGTGEEATEHRFTGKERDSESGLDYFGARYYASNMGRFMSPDWDAKPTTVPYASFGDPQTLNLYTYVENAPLNRVDADGHAAQTGFNQFWTAPDPLTGMISDYYLTPGSIQWNLLHGISVESLAEAAYYAQVQQAFAATGQKVQQQSQSQSQTPPANANMNVVLFAGYPPKANHSENNGAFFVVQWDALKLDKNGAVIPRYDPNTGLYNSKPSGAITLQENQGAGFTGKYSGRDVGSTSDNIIAGHPPFLQQWSVGGQPVRVVIGGTASHPVTAWTVKVTVTPNGPVYSAAP